MKYICLAWIQQLLDQIFLKSGKWNSATIFNMHCSAFESKSIFFSKTICSFFSCQFFVKLAIANNQTAFFFQWSRNTMSRWRERRIRLHPSSCRFDHYFFYLCNTLRIFSISRLTHRIFFSVWEKYINIHLIYLE